ncbi:MAG: carotenoid biosynthesis protein [Bacteroidales bacterium]|nr:carotenoid biosynthesis protein [Bacteroidales bacterium]
MGIFKSHITLYSRYKRFVVAFFVIFYVVGFIGMALPISQPLFIKLVPVALLLSLIVILLFHQPAFDSKTILVFATIAVSGYFIEVIGVNTHLVFGHYAYGDALGVKLLHTPLLIGLNWLMLMYAGSNVTEQIKLNGWLRVLIASFLIMLYDLVLEKIAPALDMWHWENGIVPFRNYLAWFLITFLFQRLLKVTKVRTANSLAFIIVLMQVIFFLLLLILFYSTKQ